jgi:peptidoglycan/xylan/chitin deacetylase (PgdA/CDA1 family)
MIRAARRIARAVVRAATGGAVILLYHRVARLPTDPQWLAVPPELFEEHLRALRARFRPLALAELSAGLRRRRLPRRAVVVTFDDGYADNLHAAKPALVRQGFPATVFVSAGAVGSSRGFWWDEAEQALFGDGAPTGSIDVPLGTMTRRFELGGATALGSWNVAGGDDPTLRHGAYRALCAALRTLPPGPRDAALAALAGGRELGRASHRALTAAEIGELAHGGLVEVGSHAVSHAPLARLPPEERRLEIAESRRALAGVLGAPPASFAYPFGSGDDLGEGTRDDLADAGFSCALTTIPGMTWVRSDPFALPRLMARDWPADELVRRVEEAFRGAA